MTLKYNFCRSKVSVMYKIMKAVCPFGSHHNDLMTTHTFGNMMYRYTLLVPMELARSTRKAQ